MQDLLNFSKAEFEAAYGLAGQLPQGGGPQFVFAGRSNVGKSSLINRLCGRKSLARVSQTPGKTATVNFYKVGECRLVDLPGYGYAKTSGDERRRWDALINAYFAAKPDIRLLLQLLDCRHAPSKDDLGMLEYLRHYDIPFVAALTKADKLKPSQRERTMREFSELPILAGCKGIVLCSAEKGLGIEELRDMMRRALGE